MTTSNKSLFASVQSSWGARRCSSISHRDLITLEKHSSQVELQFLLIGMLAGLSCSQQDPSYARTEVQYQASQRLSALGCAHWTSFKYNDKHRTT